MSTYSHPLDKIIPATKPIQQEPPKRSHQLLEQMIDLAKEQRDLADHSLIEQERSVAQLIEVNRNLSILAKAMMLLAERDNPIDPKKAKKTVDK